LYASKRKQILETKKVSPTNQKVFEKKKVKKSICLPIRTWIKTFKSKSCMKLGQSHSFLDRFHNSSKSHTPEVFFTEKKKRTCFATSFGLFQNHLSQVFSSKIFQTQ